MSIEDQKAIVYRTFTQNENIDKEIEIIKDFNRVKDLINKS